MISPHDPIAAPTAEPPGLAAGLLAAERWAESVKAQSIYPPGHHRVASALDALQQALEAARLARGSASDAPLQLVFSDGGLLVDGARTDVDPDGPLAWLRTRLDHAALAGLAFLEDVTRADLDAVGRRLLEIFATKGSQRDPEALWRGEWHGLRLLNRRFEGLFDGTAADSQRAQRTWGPLGPRVDAGARLRLAESLRDDPEIRERLALIRRRMRAESTTGDPGPEESGVELLQRLAGMLPASAAGDPARVRAVTSGLLDALEQRLEEQGGAAGLSAFFEDPGLERRVVFLCTALFKRNDAPREAPTEAARAEKDARRSQGHAGDDRVTDDLAAFRMEVDSLGEPYRTLEAAPALEDAGEELGVLLHLLLHDHAPESLPGLQPALVRVLAASSRDQVAVVKRVIEAASLRADAAEAPDGLRRVVDALRAAGAVALLRAAGYLSPERMRERFPAEFLTYLDALHLDQPGDREELVRLVGTLGPQAVRAASSTLSKPDALLEPSRSAALLALPKAGLAPLVRILSQHGGPALRRPVVAWLRTLALPQREARVLDVLEDPGTLPEAYLELLFDLLEGKPAGRSGEALLTGMLTRFVRSTAGRSERSARRIQALHLLAACPMPEAEEVLREVAYARRWLILPREPKSFRLAARAALAARGAA